MNYLKSQSSHSAARWAATCLCLSAVFHLVGCGPSEKKKLELAEIKRVECLDKFCPGDVEPPHDYQREEALKLNGTWYVGPKEYFSAAENGGGFYWPSRHPMYKGGDYSDYGKPFYEVAIEIFLRSSNIPPPPTGYQFILLAESNDWILNRRQLRSGLEAIQMKHVLGPTNHYIDHVTYYVATNLKGLDGLPPVATCSHDDAKNGGGTGFMWLPGVWLGTRMNQKHCIDWPEIYLETMRVINQLKRVNP
jgi:hypothetical protein